jgi:spore coat polysaccharide biosynthesis protein SpsF (cytidylyltransferase family)
MTSARLPGKSLRPLCGKPLLQYVLERLRRLDCVAEIVVATSTDRSDGPIAAFCEQFGCACFRGPLENVAERFVQTATAHGFSAFVRVNGDSPLLDQCLVGRGVALFAKENADLVTNVFPRTFPAGMSVEVIGVETLRRTLSLLAAADDREHVTPYFYGHADRFRIVNFARDAPRRDVHFAVDTQGQFDHVERIVAAMRRPHWDYSLDAILALCDSWNDRDEQARAAPSAEVRP